MPDEFGEKTEEPTDRRRSEAREKGNVARSQDLSAAGMMLVAAGLIGFLGLPLSESVVEYSRWSLGSVRLTISNEDAVRTGEQLAELAGSTVLVWMFFLFIGAVTVNVAQVGFLVAPSALEPKLSRIHPWEGAKRIISVQALVKLGTSLGKLVVLGVISVAFTWWQVGDFPALLRESPARIIGYVHWQATLLAFALAAGLLVLALLDYLFQLWKHEQDLKMTKQEVREEMKNMEGDPHVRARRKEAHRKLAAAREVAATKDADVVVTNPTHFSVALKYDPEVHGAPVVVAKGVDDIAMRIRHIAAEHGVPVLERPEIARALYRDVDVGRPIPSDLYEVFVEIMAYVYEITGRVPQGL